MKVLVKFRWEFRRMGSVEGIFTCEKGALDAAIGKMVNFGSILGKHSEIFGKLESEDVEIIGVDQRFIKEFEDKIGSSGYNPLEYLDEDDEEDEESSLN